MESKNDISLFENSEIPLLFHRENSGIVPLVCFRSYSDSSSTRSWRAGSAGRNQLQIYIPAVRRYRI
jgi:hypothetical protein